MSTASDGTQAGGTGWDDSREWATDDDEAAYMDAPDDFPEPVDEPEPADELPAAAARPADGNSGAAPGAAGPDLSAAVAAALAGADLGKSVEAAVQRAMRKRMDKIAGDALGAVLDDAGEEQLRAAAQAAATAALTGQPAPTTKTAKPYYATLDAFVAEVLAPTYRRLIDGRRHSWCAQWWQHAEGIARLEALWRAWEHLRLDPALGASAWFREHADHHMPILLDAADGPFKYCGGDKGHTTRLEPLPLDGPPAGFFQPPPT